MSDEKNRAPAVHIDRRHQSAPKETDADKAVRLAAQEIDEGKWVAPADEMNMPDVALMTGPRGRAQEFAQQGRFDMNALETTRQTLDLGKHPRVIEALAKLEEEKSTARTSQEYVEKTAMLFELNAMSKRGEHWDGETRWQGAENEEMRRGEVLKPIQFYERLMRVIGKGVQWAEREHWVGGRRVCTIGNGRVLLGRHGVRLNDVGAYRVPLLVMGADLTQNEAEPMQVATLQYPLATEWMVMGFDEFGVPTSAKHIGWRTALLSMIRLGVISEKEAHKAFPLGTGPAAAWYREQLFEWANHRPMVIH